MIARGKEVAANECVRSCCVGSPKQEGDRDDKDGHFIMHGGDTLGYDHRCLCIHASAAHNVDRIVKLLGEGTFGKVVECYDRDSAKRHVFAIKFIKSIEKYR